jgi:hypothetical protein
MLMKQQAYTFFSAIGWTSLVVPKECFVSERNSPCWDQTAWMCSKIASEFQRYGVPVIFVPLPMVYYVQPELFYDHMDFLKIPRDSVDLEQPHRLLKEAMRQDSLRVIDPLEHMRKQARQGLAMHGKIDRHFNPAGHESVTEYIFPYVEEILAPLIQAQQAHLGK